MRARDFVTRGRSNVGSGIVLTVVLVVLMSRGRIWDLVFVRRTDAVILVGIAAAIRQLLNSTLLDLEVLLRWLNPINGMYATYAQAQIIWDDSRTGCSQGVVSTPTVGVNGK
jgi:hypothetical protein